MRSTNGAFVWLALGVAAALLLPVLAMDGMFMDGMLYSVVAHNQANGFGSFWFPRFSQMNVAGLETFHEHPPLTFGLQALWFRIFGSAFWVERAYSLIAAVITGWLMVQIWRSWTGDRPGVARLAWLPVLLWIIIPTVHWCFHNNMMENTMGMFTTAAVLFAVRARAGRFWTGHIIGGIMVFLAVMAKGVPGLFPLGAPVLLAVAATGRLDRGFGGSMVMTLVAILCFGLLLLDDQARTALAIHVEHRLMHRVAEVPTVQHRWATLEMLFTNMLGPLIIVVLVLVSGRGRLKDGPATGDRSALAMAFIGISGVFPLMLTMVQKSFYMAPALPILALALGLWCAPVVAGLLEKLRREGRTVRLVRWLGITALAGSIIAAIILFGSPHRDEDMLHDVSKIGALVPEGTLITVPEDMWNDWNLQGYLMRHHFISVSHTHAAQWHLTRQEHQPVAGMAQEPLDLRLYDLWRMK